jgi:hypothetical protein
LYPLCNLSGGERADRKLKHVCFPIADGFRKRYIEVELRMSKEDSESNPDELFTQRESGEQPALLSSVQRAPLRKPLRTYLQNVRLVHELQRLLLAEHPEAARNTMRAAEVRVWEHTFGHLP